MKKEKISSKYAIKLRYRKALAGSVGGQAFFVNSKGTKTPKPLPFFVDAD